MVPASPNLGSEEPQRRPRPEPRPQNAIDLGRGTWVSPGKIHWSFSRAGGPGGQHVNTTSSRATLRVRLDDIGGLNDAARARLVEIASRWLAGADELLVHADEFRSQLGNREAALDRLRAVVVQAATPPKVRRKTKPTRGSKERRIESKKREGVKKSRRQWRPE